MRSFRAKRAALRCRWLEPAALEDDGDQVVAGVGEVRAGHALAVDAADLVGEVGVVLGAGPDQEDKVHGVDRVHLAGGDPGIEYGSAAPEPVAVILVEMFGKALAAADDFHGEDLRGLGMAPREFHLDADVLGQGGGRVVVDGEVVEGRIPELEDVPHDFHVQPQLAVEIVVHVGLGQPGAAGDGVHAGALEAVAGELLGSRGEDGFLVLLANAAGRFALGVVEGLRCVVLVHVPYP